MQRTFPLSRQNKKSSKPYGFKDFSLVRVARFELTASWSRKSGMASLILSFHLCSSSSLPCIFKAFTAVAAQFSDIACNSYIYKDKRIVRNCVRIHACCYRNKSAPCAHFKCARCCFFLPLNRTTHFPTVSH